MIQEVTRGEGDRRFLIVRSGALRCALPASDVVRVVRGLPCHPIPGAQIHLLGLSQYGGEPLPVLDLHALVEGGPSGLRHRSTVILGRARRRDRSVLGLAVDEVLRVAELPELAPFERSSGLVVGSVVVDGGAITVVNTGSVLDGEPEVTGALDG